MYSIQMKFSLLPALLGGGMLHIIRSIWFSVEDPGKTGLPNSISPNMQPKLHMSTPFVYLVKMRPAVLYT